MKNIFHSYLYTNYKQNELYDYTKYKQNELYDLKTS